MKGWAIVLVTVCGCRFGFSEVTPAADADVPADAAPPVPGTARVTVTGEEGEPLAGQPIAGAYVFVVEAGSVTALALTKSDGTATVPILGGSAIHIARPVPGGAQRWLLYSFTGLNGDPQVLVGGRAPAPAAPKTMSAVLPAFTDPQITASRVRGPARCLDFNQAPTAGTTTTFTFAAACANETLELYAQGLASGEPWMWTPLGQVTLTDGASITAPGVWQDHVKYYVDYAGLPGSISDVRGLLVLPGGAPGTAGARDAIVLDDDSTSVAAGEAGLVYDGPQLVAGSRLASFFIDPTTAIERRVVERVDTPFGNRMFDTSLIGPEVSVPLADATAGSVSWASSGLGDADFVAIATTVSTPSAVVTWSAYGPASTTALAYPELPTELAAIVAGSSASWSAPQLKIVSLSDFTYASALPILDRDLYWWHEVGAYLPDGTMAVSAAQQVTTNRPAPVSRFGGAGPAGSARAHRLPSTARR